MKSLYPGIIPELEKEIVLSDIEQKALLFYIKLGRFFKIFLSDCSLILILYMVRSKCISMESSMFTILIICEVLAVISIVKSIPIIFCFLKDFIVYIFCKDNNKEEFWERGRFLLTAYYGWDLIFQKKVGAKEKILHKAADFYSDAVSDMEALTNIIKQKLDLFNDREKIEAKDKLPCYQCLFEAAHELGVINTKYYYKDYPSPIAIERFLSCLGSEYEYTKQNFGKGKLKQTTVINTYEKYCIAKEFISDIKQEMSICLKTK